MFTGIIKAQAKIKKVSMKDKVLYAEFTIPSKWKLVKGESIAINGICSTVASFDTVKFKVGYMQETINKTTVSNWTPGDAVNLERSLRLGDTLDGHFVYGHVDVVGTVKSITHQGDSRVFEMVIPKEFLKFVVYKGSVAIDGVSLTVSARNPKSFTVSLIPYTLQHTNLGDLKVGDGVNVETDVMGKYVIESQKVKGKS